MCNYNINTFRWTPAYFTYNINEIIIFLSYAFVKEMFQKCSAVPQNCQLN